MSFHYWLNSKADEQQKKDWSNKGMDVRIHISYSRVCTHTIKPCIMSCHVPDTCYVQHHIISYHSMSYYIYIYNIERDRHMHIYIYIHTQEQADPAHEVAHLPHAQLPDRHRGHQLEAR